MPPIPGKHGAFAPPFPSGHPELRAWFEDHHQDVAPSGRAKVPEQVETVCIDFNGVTRAGERACIGAYRYPEDGSRLVDLSRLTFRDFKDVYGLRVLRNDWHGRCKCPLVAFGKGRMWVEKEGCL